MGFADLYSFVQEFWIPEDADSYWEELITRATELFHKYEDNEFVKNTIFAYINAKETEYHKKSTQK